MLGEKEFLCNSIDFTISGTRKPRLSALEWTLGLILVQRGRGSVLLKKVLLKADAQKLLLCALVVTFSFSYSPVL